MDITQALLERHDEARENGTCPEVFEIAVADIRPAIINDTIYGQIDPNDPSLDELAHLMTVQGQLEEIVVTLDNVLLSGHRRRAVAIRHRWKTLKAKHHPILSTDPDFSAILVSWNCGRDKTPAMRIREQLVLTDPESAYENLVSERAEASRVNAETLTLGAGRRRWRISVARQLFLEAVIRVIDDLRPYWPLSDRRVHYSLLNDPPLIHASKGETYRDKKGTIRYNRYRNDRKSYKAVCDLLTRARLEGLIPFDAIGDDTRPVTTWDVYPNVGPFFRDQVNQFCTGYWRDLMQSQPNHIEIVGEKLTIEGIVRPIAMKYCIPYTIGRGYSSLPPRIAMYDRFQKSGKAKLVILFVTDHDPEGWDIPETFTKSMRDDFGIDEVVAIKVALKPEQVLQLNLPPNTEAKRTSSRYKKFAKQFGPTAYELEAVPPATLEEWLDKAVRAVIDIDLFNAEVEAEKQDAAAVAAFKQASLDYLKGLHEE
jgi:hypothetical protein